MKNLFFIFLALTLSWPAGARETLRFKAPADDYRDRIVSAYLVQNAPQTRTPFKFARIDLNGDGVPEYIARPAGTDARTLTPHHVLSLRRRQITDWGTIPATKMEISDKKHYGFRDILVYNNTRNDFYHDVWEWNGTAFAKSAPSPGQPPKAP
jgi:hypothetical protein